MLLTELVDLEKIRKTKHSIDPFLFPERMAGKTKEELGSGVSAVAFKSKKPNTVSKISYHSSPNDGYIQYIKAIHKNQNNPFFPRIYNAKLYQGESDDLYALYVEMEKLIPLKNERMIETAPHLFDQVGLDWDRHRPEDWNNPQKIREVIQSTKNPKFAEALRILSPFMVKFGSDLHRNNIMVRLTGAGPQLVITDPVIPSVGVYPTTSGRKPTPAPPQTNISSDDDVTPDVTPQA